MLDFVRRWLSRRKAVGGIRVAPGEKAEGGIQTVRNTGLLLGDQALAPPDNPAALLAAYREWVYVCATKNAQGVASVPLRLYSTAQRAAGVPRSMRTPTRKVSYSTRKALEANRGIQKYIRTADEVYEILEHPFYTLWENGNPFLTGTLAAEIIVLHVDIVGDNYTYIDMGPYGPRALYTLPPELMRIKVNSAETAIEYYEQSQEHGLKTVKIPSDRIIHYKHPDPSNIIYGKSPLEAIGLAASLYHDYNRFEVSLLRNDAVPGTIIRTERPLSDSQARREERKWGQKYGGPNRAGHVAFVSGVTGIDRLGYAQREMAFPQGRKATREDIAGAYSVPMPLLISDGSNLAQADDAAAHHARYAIKPRCVLIEEQINRDLMPKYLGGETLFVAFDDPTPVDAQHNLERAKVMVTTKKLVFVNEGRAALGLDPDPDREDEYIGDQEPEPEPMPFPDMPKPGEEPEEGDEAETEEDEEEEKKAAGQDPRYDIEKIMRRYFSQQERDIDGWLKQTNGLPQNIPIPEEQDRKLSLLIIPAIKFQVKQGALSGANRREQRMKKAVDPELGISFDIGTPEVADAIATRAFRFSFAVNDATRKRLRQILDTSVSEGASITELRKEVQSLFQFSKEYRAARIARTEIAAARQTGTLAEWRQSGVVSGYYWDALPDTCFDCAEMAATYGKNGTHLTFGNTYPSGDRESPFGPLESPPLHPNCRCMLQPILSPEYE